MSFLTRNNLNFKSAITHQDITGAKTLQDIKDIVNCPETRNKLTVFAWGSLKGTFMRIKSKKEEELRNCLFEKDGRKILEELKEIEELKKSYLNFK